MNDRGEISLDDYKNCLTERTKFVAVTHVSNALGTINPVAEMIALAHQNHSPILIDGAQAIAHCQVDEQQLDCDFYAFSGHKLYGPTGIGVLYGKQRYLEAMPPYQGGGDMIKHVSFTHSTYNDLPYKFEAGTPDIAGAIGLGAALDYLQSLDIAAIIEHEQQLLAYASKALSTIPDLRLIGTAQHKTSILSFLLSDIHVLDVGTLLDQLGIAIRVGHHCAMPIMDYYQVAGTARVSIGLYNTVAEIDCLVSALERIKRMF
jgi:cysteine desulfurase/selenocysteine lyase